MEYIEIDFKRCVYCGEPPAHWDHAFPQIHRWTLPTGYVSWVVPSCAECNHIAYAKVFRTFGEKADHIKERLEVIYADRLEDSDWINRRINWELGALEDVEIVTTVLGDIPPFKADRDTVLSIIRRNRKERKICHVCENFFKPLQTWRKFCSRYCAEKWEIEHKRRALDFELDCSESATVIGAEVYNPTEDQLKRLEKIFPLTPLKQDKPVVSESVLQLEEIPLRVPPREIEVLEDLFILELLKT